ncbi:MAG: deoxyribodipyrimidine photo-lyase [Candidatus Saccharimonadales bacterium]
MEKSHISNSELKLRLRQLGTSWHNPEGECVLYIMSRDQRVHDNHALIAAQKHALAHGLPLAVIFNFNVTKAPRAREHYDFMIAGLYQVERELNNLNIPLIGLVGEHLPRLEALCHHVKPAAIYVDFSPLNGPQSVHKKLAKDYTIIEVDTHNIVPAWIASEKQEVGARTLRPKINHYLPTFCIEPELLVSHPIDWPNKAVIRLEEVVDIFGDRLAAVRHSGINHGYQAGETAAKLYLQMFIDSRLKGYATLRNDPSVDGLSGMSPYLHFGQISSLRIVLEAAKAVKQDASLKPDYDTLIEELVVRKELSDNFCLYNQNYALLEGAPQWAQKTLQKHASDPREFMYSLEQFERAETHDEAWNAAQTQLTQTGKIHGYMRMYWAKKILEWSSSPEEALQILLYLNDFYSLDGGDPNGYVGILWSIAGLHDRLWGERAVYGTVRSMVYNGLKRKFDIQAYISQNQHDKVKKSQ